MSSDYPRKYWWVVLILVPLAAALIGVLPQFWENHSSPTSSIQISNTEFSGDLHFANVEVILQEYQQFKGKPLTDANTLSLIEQGVNLVKGGEYAAAIPLFKEVVKQADLPSIHNNLGVLYAENKDYAGARHAYQQSIARQPDNQMVQLNLGLLDQKEGNIEDAKRHFAKAPDLEGARTLKKNMEKQISEGTVESEPNNQLNMPNSLGLAISVQGAIANASDKDIFSFTTPEDHRDWMHVQLFNHSDGFRPYVRVRTAEKNQIGGPTAEFGGQDLSYQFVGGPERKYLVIVGGYHKTTGSYDLKVVPSQRYDSFEPNNSKDTPRPILFAKTIQANIMDGHDQDYYLVKTAQDTGKVSVTLEASSSLRPYVRLYTANKKGFGGPTAENSGQNLSFEFDGSPSTEYIVFVGGYHKTTGTYQLSVQNK